MKEWVRHHPYLALASGYILFFVLTTGIWFAVGQHNLGDALITAFVWTLGYWFVAMFETRRRNKTKARLEEHDQFMAYIRYPDSPTGSLSSIWNQGVATPSVGSISCKPPPASPVEVPGVGRVEVALGCDRDREDIELSDSGLKRLKGTYASRASL